MGWFKKKKKKIMPLKKTFAALIRILADTANR